MKTLNQDGQSPDQDSNPGPTKYNAQALNTQSNTWKTSVN
jgi:hypothetical protein